MDIHSGFRRGYILTLDFACLQFFDKKKEKQLSRGVSCRCRIFPVYRRFVRRVRSQQHSQRGGAILLRLSRIVTVADSTKKSKDRLQGISWKRHFSLDGKFCRLNERCSFLVQEVCCSQYYHCGTTMKGIGGGIAACSRSAFDGF
nr:uncharacterized protein LOC115258216 [Aedes albopictus]